MRPPAALMAVPQRGSIKARQEILGHTAASLTLNTYAHIVAPTARTEMSKMDELFVCLNQEK